MNKLIGSLFGGLTVVWFATAYVASLFGMVKFIVWLFA